MKQKYAMRQVNCQSISITKEKAFRQVCEITREFLEIVSVFRFVRPCSSCIFYWKHAGRMPEYIDAHQGLAPVGLHNLVLLELRRVGEARFQVLFAVSANAQI